jgi:V/A-type H+-transporting ATPase subunit D
VTARTAPTRAARQQLVRRRALADRAAGLLRSKEEALERERVRLGGHDTRAREEWERRWQEAVRELLLARALGAGPELERIVPAAPPTPATVAADWQTSMGITFPGSVDCEPGAPPALTSTAALRPAAAVYRRALVAAAELAATSAAVHRLEVELAATRRRRRAVEERLQPQLETSLRTLDVQLDELDREAALRVRTVLGRREDDRP